MKLIRNLAWGLLVAGWVGALISVIPIGLSVVSSSTRAEIAEMGGLLRLLLGYVTAAFACGLVLGLLRPITRYRWGSFVVGGSVTTVAFGTFLTILLGFPLLGSWSQAAVIVPLIFVVGVVATPMWQSVWMPDWDRVLAGLQNTAVLSSSRDESDDPAGLDG